MKHIYCISGFGADERVFSKLDFGKNDLHFIQWKIPEKNETLSSYVERMRHEIIHPRPVLIGLSFGGMIAIEIAKIIPVEKVILISSIAVSDEMPLLMRVAGSLHLNRIFPIRPSAILAPIENWNLSVETAEEKKLVADYRKNIDLRYAHWAIENILQWKNDWRPPNLVHIHGSKDHIFPLKYVKTDYVIHGAGHLLLMNHAAEVNAILHKELQ